SSDVIHWQYLTPLSERYIDSWSLAITPRSVIAGDHYWHFFDKEGEAWERSEEIDEVVKQRHNHLFYYRGATEADDTVISSDNDRASSGGIIAYSDDDGRSFQQANYPDGSKCGGSIIAARPGGNLVSGDGDVCFSRNGGRDWSRVTGLPLGIIVSKILWLGDRFRLYIGYNQEAAIYQSVDGEQWSLEAPRVTLDGNSNFGRRRHPLYFDQDSGSYVSKFGDVIARSSDGIHFTSVSIPEDQNEGHPVRFFTGGDVAVGPTHPCY
ncbi:MAG: hypothetical protein AAF203_04830, partial [Pseudomonadota bacterium]